MSISQGAVIIRDVAAQLYIIFAIQSYGIAGTCHL